MSLIYPVFLVAFLCCDGHIILTQTLQKLRASMDREAVGGEGVEGLDEDSENSQLLRLMARHTQLKDLLHAHHIIGTSYTCDVFPSAIQTHGLMHFPPFYADVTRWLQHHQDPPR